MYLKKILLENVGPISFADISLPFNQDSKPKPIIFVGENGSGKSILLSYIVNACLISQQFLFDDSELERGKVYKLRSPSYIKIDSNYSFGKIEFEEGLTCLEWQLNRKRKDFEDEYKMTPIYKEWEQIPQDSYEHFSENFRHKISDLESIYNKNCLLYFPPNRFEEPAWLNWDNLNAKATFTDIKRVKGFLNRQVINYAPLRSLQDWLFDVIYDRNVLDFRVNYIPISSSFGNQVIFPGFEGESTNIYSSILLLLKKIFQVNEDIILRLGVGKRSYRKVELVSNQKILIPNIFQLSTGETALINLFLTILRDYDLCESTKFESLEKICGLVLIDEIDIHLHSLHQKNILPELISLFPGIQFIITSHSPLFILGLKEKLGEDGFQIIELPKAKEISPEQFSEFEKAYSFFKNTKRYDEDIRTAIEKSSKPILFLEGEYDMKYLTKAAESLGKIDILSKINLQDSGGYGNIDKVWNHFNTKLAEITPQKILLLYDCDIQKNECQKGNVFRKTMPHLNNNPIKKGIENLFSIETLKKALEEKPAFIDIAKEHEKIVRGKTINIPETWEVNKDEKKNLCDWLCTNGKLEDFAHFKDVLEIIEKILN